MARKRTSRLRSQQKTKEKMQLNLRKQIIKKWETKEERTKNYKNGSTLLLSSVFATAT